MPSWILALALVVAAATALTLGVIGVRRLLADVRTPTDRRDIPHSYTRLLDEVPPHPRYEPYRPGLTRYADVLDTNADTKAFPLARTTSAKEATKS